MTVMVKNILAQRANVWEQAKALLDAAEAEGRALSAEEQRSFDEMNADLSRLDEQRQSIEDAEQRAKDADEAMRGFSGAAQPTGVEESLRAFFKGEQRSFDSNAGLPRVNFRDLVKGTPAAGGNTVPTSFRDQLLEHMIESSGVLMAGPTILNTTSGEAIEVPVTTAYSQAKLTAEATAIDESDPAFAKRTLGAYKYAVLLQISSELIADTAVDLEGFVARQAGRACGNALGVDLVVGDGTNKPAGVATGATAGTTGKPAVAGAFTSDDLIDLFYSVIAPYRTSSSCGWLMKDSTLGAVRKLKENGANGAYLWQPSIQVGVPDTLLGKPVYTDPNVAAPAVGAKSVIFGDFSAYFVRLAGGVRFETSTDFAFDKDLVTYRAIVRGDGLLADLQGAVKAFVGGAAS